ncbi:hypothetical protein [Streptosporangium sp. NPDC000396]|uniref:hypothetical protein n=1 Tax=Streptosporangium sp. NPDC000396 TaxID=3366185 RepID=UPI0036B25F5E
MTDASDSSSGIPENPLVAELIAHGVGNDARLLRGFVGPSRNENVITLYQRLDRLSDTVEIARSDILHHVKAPRSPLGGVILWVKKDAKITINRLEPPEPRDDVPQSDLQELRKGRLRMRVRGHGGRETCFSVCMDCLSWCSCSICTSTCTPE